MDNGQTVPGRRWSLALVIPRNRHVILSQRPQYARAKLLPRGEAVDRADSWRVIVWQLGRRGRRLKIDRRSRIHPGRLLANTGTLGRTNWEISNRQEKPQASVREHWPANGINIDRLRRTRTYAGPYSATTSGSSASAWLGISPTKPPSAVILDLMSSATDGFSIR